FSLSKLGRKWRAAFIVSPGANAMAGGTRQAEWFCEKRSLLELASDHGIDREAIAAVHDEIEQDRRPQNRELRPRPALIHGDPVGVNGDEKNDHGGEGGRARE